VELQAGSPGDYLHADEIVESESVAVAALAARLRAEHPDAASFSRAAYEWVRDCISHSVDVQDPRVTVTATEVLRAGVGLCFAKSHLLVAVLRNQGIPAGLCYQRLADGEGFALHGLVAVHLGGVWHRLDPRGNREAINAQFNLATEQLAWIVDPAIGEVDYPTVFATPSPAVIAALRASDDALQLCAGGLPITP
jgi:transglutaminase-like putative cysteine protease